MASSQQMVTAVHWVRRGVTKELPDQYKEELGQNEDDDDNDDAMKDEDEGEDDDDEDVPMNPNNPEDKYNMENYDDEDEASPFLGGSLTSLMMHKNPKKDPYLVVPESAQDMDDFMIRKEDMILLAAVSEEEVSHLDVYVYEYESDNLYVHHDYLLPAFPLCLSWLSFPVGGQQLSGNRTSTNYVAVGTFEPYIEIWDLDMVDQPAPLALLGGPEKPEDLVNGSVKDMKLIPESHTDSVLGLSWNTIQQNVLASCSADRSVKLWDLMSGSCVRTYNNHKDKVQSVLWNPAEAAILASGGFDSAVMVVDVRAPNAAAMSTNLRSDIESITWLPSPHHNHILVSTEDGFVYCFDILKDFSVPLWKLQAHHKATQSIAANPSIPGLIATGSADSASPLKLWDISTGKPSCLYSKTSDMGPVFSVRWSPDEPLLLALGTQSTRPEIIDCRTLAGIASKYGHIRPPTTTTTTTAPDAPLVFTYTGPSTTTATTGTTTTTTTTTTPSSEAETGNNKSAKSNKSKRKGKKKKKHS